jgi:DNA (cytosine-5)-methyltransferase 1
MKLKLLDLFCCGGGAGMGYSNVGFDVTGVDINPQHKYPFEFVQGDAIEYLINNHHKYDAIHASPPCQNNTKSTLVHKASGKKYDCFIARTREALIRIGKPFIIENTMDAPLIDPIMLCGGMFGLKTYRHRLFESNLKLTVPHHPVHVAKNAKMGRAPNVGEFIQVVGHFSGVKFAQEAMGIEWLGQKELAQAIPPIYTEFLGAQLMLECQKIKRNINTIKPNSL